MRVGSQHRSSSNASLIKHAAWPDGYTIADLRILHHRIRSDPAIGADASLAQQLHKWLYCRVHADFNFGVNHATPRIEYGHAFIHQLPAFVSPHFLIELDEFCPRVAADNLSRIVRL